MKQKRVEGEFELNEDDWYVIELKGFRRRAGQIREVEWAGTKWVRIDMPLQSDGSDWDIEHFHPSVIYSFHRVSEAEAYRQARLLIEGV